MSKNVVKDLSVRLSGRRVMAVKPSAEEESTCLLELDDGTSFTLFATDLGAWTKDGPMSDGTYPGIDSLVMAVDAARSEHGDNLSEGFQVLGVSVSESLMSVEVYEGEFLSVRLSSVTDPWEKKVLSHPDVLSFMGRVVSSGDVWKMWFADKTGYCSWVDGDLDLIPKELKVP